MKWSRVDKPQKEQVAIGCIQYDAIYVKFTNCTAMRCLNDLVMQA
jgi:hypothetical protein